MSIADTLTWKLCHFDQLSSREVYELARLRINVFVVEQACAYPELDGVDLLSGTAHLFAVDAAQPVAYARVIAPESPTSVKPDASASVVYIGRVQVARSYRGRGLATQLMHRALDYCTTQYAGHAVALAAQVQVMDFYSALGFIACSEHYLEDGIAHVNMQRRVSEPVRS